MSDPREPDLDALFAQARADTVPSDALMARVAADAALVAATVAAEAKEPDAREAKPGLWTQMMDAVGGWPSMSGLVTAAVAGLYIGFSDPTMLEVVGLSETTDVTSDLLFGDDMYFDDASTGEG